MSEDGERGGLPPEPPSPPSPWAAFFGAGLLIIHALSLPSSDGGWDTVWETFGVVAGVLILATWWREGRVFRTWERANRPDPPGRPPWA